MLDGSIARHGSDGEPTVPLADVREVRNAIEVDQQVGPGQPEVQQRDQALAAGQELGLAVGRAKRLDGLVERTWGDVVERRRLQGRKRKDTTVPMRPRRTDDLETRPSRSTKSN